MWEDHDLAYVLQQDNHWPTGGARYIAKHVDAPEVNQHLCSTDSHVLTVTFGCFKYALHALLDY